MDLTGKAAIRETYLHEDSPDRDSSSSSDSSASSSSIDSINADFGKEPKMGVMDGFKESVKSICAVITGHRHVSTCNKSNCPTYVRDTAHFIETDEASRNARLLREQDKHDETNDNDQKDALETSSDSAEAEADLDHETTEIQHKASNKQNQKRKVQTTVVKVVNLADTPDQSVTESEQTESQ